MNRCLNIIALAVLLALAALLTGCQSRIAASRPSAAMSVKMDPCADRLHDLCGMLLLYYAAHKELPERLTDLDKAGAPLAVPLACPRSGKPYAYNREGLQVNGRPGRLIVYDAQACHSLTRWGILAETPRPDSPLVVHVVQLPETAIRWESRRDDQKYF